jgi:hypothetical protein
METEAGPIQFKLNRKSLKLQLEISSIKDCEQMIRNSTGSLDIYEAFTLMTKKPELVIPDTLLKLPGQDAIFLYSTNNCVEILRQK